MVTPRSSATPYGASARISSGDPAGLDAAEAAARKAQLVPERTPEVTQWSDPRVLYAELAICSERFVEAERLLTDILSEAEQKRYPMNLFEGQFLLVEVLRRTGRLHQALDRRRSASGVGRAHALLASPGHLGQDPGPPRAGPAGRGRPAGAGGWTR